MAIPAYYSLLRRGSSGPDVAMVQTWLNGVRDACTWHDPLKADGKFGLSTENAVKEFQLKNKMNVDGKVGANTWNVLYTQYTCLLYTSQLGPGGDGRLQGVGAQAELVLLTAGHMHRHTAGQGGDGLVAHKAGLRDDAVSYTHLAVMAAYWLVVGALMMALWWILVMIRMMGAGPQA